MGYCTFCERDIPLEFLTKHHLEPKNPKSETVPACDPCHKQIHAIFTNHELINVYDTPERVRNHEEMQKFIKWVQKSGKLDIQVSESQKVRNWRR